MGGSAQALFDQYGGFALLGGVAAAIGLASGALLRLVFGALRKPKGELVRMVAGACLTAAVSVGALLLSKAQTYQAAPVDAAFATRVIAGSVVVVALLTTGMLVTWARRTDVARFGSEEE